MRRIDEKIAKDYLSEKVIGAVIRYVVSPLRLCVDKAKHPYSDEVNILYITDVSYVTCRIVFINCDIGVDFLGGDVFRIQYVSGELEKSARIPPNR